MCQLLSAKGSAKIASMTFDQILKKFHVPTPAFHVVLGSGFGRALDQVNPSWTKMGEASFSEVTGLSPTTVQDHQGKYVFYTNDKIKKSVSIQCGRLHGYEGHTPQQVVQTVLFPRQAGIKNFILTNAAGGIREGFSSGDAMIITDHVNFTGKNPLTGPVTSGERFPDMSLAYDRTMSASLKESLEKNSLRVHQGIYLGLLGPNFETPGEIQLFKRWGMDAVGMSTVWEVLALRQSGATVSALSLISNMAAGLTPGEIDHNQVLATCRNSAEKIVHAVFSTMENN